MSERTILEDKIVKSVSESMKEYFNIPYCALVSSGTIALEIALKALLLPRGSKVLVPDISFIATATAVANVGLIPIYSDCSIKTMGLSLEIMKKIIEEDKDIKAVIVVHFAGIVNRNIVEISEYCRENSLFLIEDCAQVFGAGFKEMKCGTFGDVSAFSFQTSKIITCGEGGMILSKSYDIGNRVVAISDWGLDLNGERQWSLPCGNYRISQFGANYLQMQLREKEQIYKERYELYSYFVWKLLQEGIEIQVLATDSNYKDMPFFILTKTNQPIHFLHPLGEYPMHLFKLVSSILRTFYPDLGEQYELNILKNDYKHSIKIVQSTNFIPLHGVKQGNIDRLISNLL